MAMGDTHTWAGSNSMRMRVYTINNYIYGLSLCMLGDMPPAFRRPIVVCVALDVVRGRWRSHGGGCPWVFAHIGAEIRAPRQNMNARAPSARESAADTPGMRSHTSSVHVEQKYAPRHHLAASEPMRHKCGCSRPRTKSDVSTFKNDCGRRRRQSQCRP